ncbi:class I SAM-dependent methyltransferase [Sinomicrobium kalidii]|uniref:class I SAM-dependent methyltransferase n=1 Tax=Sinomicrobium kalidii TaxID=2900738 RepID=UPI001E48F9C3|nr:class I SAM-dependent methyltransferase [Sinomicrobium kalidii]UGU14699.1 class I SAM-dependent methyltransferase [Sinomicrobium kalidii]
MVHSDIFGKNVGDYEAWYARYDAVYKSEIRALREHFTRLPENITGIEVGAGTGRFALPLGIKEGVEPSDEMAALAVKRGIEIVKGYAEALPYKDVHFDFVLFVTICHLNNVKKALREAFRVLKDGGLLIIGFIEKDGEIARSYMEKRKRSIFYRHASFYRTGHLKRMILDCGFRDLRITQTLFGNPDEITEEQAPKTGYGEGSFIVISALRR